jgi:hypothetical protein
MWIITIWHRHGPLYYRAPSKTCCLLQKNATRFRSLETAKRRAVGLVFEHDLKPERVKVTKLRKR